MKVGFTGSRKGITIDQFERLKELLRELEPEEAHHGECEGADTYFDATVHLLRDYDHLVEPRLDIRIVSHPGVNKKGKSPTRSRHCKPDERREEKYYTKRDDDIIDETNILIACPDGPEKLRSGTWTTIRHSKKKQKPIKIIWPDGRVEDVLY